jgi:twitching motility two-component system response regulator PilG/twitching motility two-component system response regulator PilH
MGRRSVLIVDDSQAVLDALTSAFEDAGYDVTSATDGEEVFRKMAAANPDALLLDIYMPKLNGADVCRLVKAHPHWKKTYLVLMSSRISERETDTYKRIGADRVLRKPFDPGRAVALVDQALGVPASRHEPAGPEEGPAGARVGQGSARRGSVS